MTVKEVRCEHIREYISTERDELRDAIDEDKWYLSEQEGHDVGWREAEVHFVAHFLKAFAKRFRRDFCEGRCPMAGRCELYRQIGNGSSHGRAACSGQGCPGAGRAG